MMGSPLVQKKQAAHPEVDALIERLYVATGKVRVGVLAARYSREMFWRMQHVQNGLDSLTEALRALNATPSPDYGYTGMYCSYIEKLLPLHEKMKDIRFLYEAIDIIELLPQLSKVANSAQEIADDVIEDTGINYYSKAFGGHNE